MTSSKIQNLIFPDIFVEHDTVNNQYKKIGMDVKSIEKNILSISTKKEIYLKTVYS